jgi:excisionase family DNA binding protein
MLMRPSELARFWELHPKTVYLWIKAGRLPAVKTPGAQFRVRSEDLPAFCEKSGLSLPPALHAASRRVAILGAGAAAQRTMKKVLKGRDLVVAWYPSALEGLVAIAESPPSLVVVDAASIDAEATVRALRRGKGTRRVAILAYQLPSAARAGATLRAGAKWALVKERDLAATLEAALP